MSPVLSVHCPDIYLKISNSRNPIEERNSRLFGKHDDCKISGKLVPIRLLQRFSPVSAAASNFERGRDERSPFRRPAPVLDLALGQSRFGHSTVRDRKIASI